MSAAYEEANDNNVNPTASANNRGATNPGGGQPVRNRATFRFSMSRNPNAETGAAANGNANNASPNGAASTGASNAATNHNPPGSNNANRRTLDADELRRRIQINARPGFTVNFNGRGIPMAAGRGRGRVRIPIRRAGRGRGGPIQFGGNGARPKPNLPRLQPQVLPEAQQELAPTNTEEDKDKEEDAYSPFKCSICYDMMNDPVGCGKCSARFCFACLKRVAELSALEQQRQPAENNNNPPRCPVCRSPMEGPEEFHRDSALRQRMDQAPPVPCRFSGCEEQLRISQVAQHEADCPFVKTACRYAPFGCCWVGKRGDLVQHEEENCNLARVSQLVERQRHLQVELAQMGHGLAHLHQSVVANASIMELQRSRDRHQLSTSDFFQLSHYVHALTCCTPRFLVTKDAWGAFHADPKGQATVANFVTLLPTNLLILKTIAASYQQMLRASRSSMETEEQLLDLLDSILYFLFVILMATVLALCFFGEASPDKWQPLHLRLPRTPVSTPESGRESQILLYSVILALAASYTFALEVSGASGRATLLWIYLCMASTVFPAMVTRMSTGVNSLPPNTPPTNVEVFQMIHAGRAARPMWLALCYAPCTVAFGILPSIDAAVMLFLAQDVLKKVIPLHVLPNGDLFAQPGGILSQIPIPALYIYSGARLAMRATEFPQGGWVPSLDFLVVALFVVATKYLLWINFKVGTYLGTRILHQSRRRINPAAAPVLRTESHGLGVSLFAVWCLLMGAIVIT